MWPPPLAHTFGKVRALDAQRLGHVQLGDGDVAGMQAILELPVDVLSLAIHPLVVDLDLALVGHVIVDHHATAAHHRHAPHLAGVEPAGVHVPQHLVRKAQHEENHVLDDTVEKRAAVDRHRLRHPPQQVNQDGNVVGSNAPQGIDVALHPAQVDAGRVDVVDLA